jgi:hypothetical protein
MLSSAHSASFGPSQNVIVNATVLNFTSLDLDAEGNPERVMPEDGDDWAAEDFAS